MDHVTNPIDILVGSRIRFRRLAMHVDIKTFAERMGVSREQMERFECGEDRILSPLLVDAAKLLGVEVVYFFAGTGVLGEEQDPSLVCDALELHRAFMRVGDAKARRQIIDLAISLASAAEN